MMTKRRHLPLFCQTFGNPTLSGKIKNEDVYIRKRGQMGLAIREANKLHEKTPISIPA